MASEQTEQLCSLAQHHYHYIQYPALYQPANPTVAALPPLPLPLPSPSLPTCQCPCSCGRASAQPQPPPSSQQNASMAVAVIVHQQSPESHSHSHSQSQSQPLPQSVLTAQSAQSLLNHSYQALQLEQEQKHLNLDSSAGAASCDCDLECSCLNADADVDANVNANVNASGGANVLGSSAAAAAAQQQKRSLLADAMLGADEITVSESDNNSTMLKKKKAPPKSLPANSCNDIYHDTELAAAAPNAGAGCRKSQSLGQEDNRPPLPPRPPPRPRSAVNSSIAHRHGAGIKKYVVWCLICGGFSCLLGVLFLGVYFLLHSYTITVGNFETVPTFVPATLLILTGVCIMSLARRRNRYSYLIKLSGACGLVSALTCALVTVTTTVLHMSRLQALRECEYAQKTRTCTCYSDLIESQVDRVDKEGVRLVFDSLSDCGVVHGSLYSCLRAIFGLSVAGVLIAVFSCMLVYQLLSHERKKMYWEQLELRCRSLYASQAAPPNLGAMTAPGRLLNCRCCEQCHAHRQLTLPLQSAAYPWDEASAAAAAAAAAGGAANAEQRFWAAQPPGNFYSPNPGGDDHPGAVCRAAERAGRSSSGWSWPRMPWQRQTPDTGRRFRQAAASPDSQYGFSSATAAADGNQMLIEEQLASSAAAAYNALPPPNALPYGVWGPPPPYSDPNSPARRGYYQYLQPSACLANGQLLAAAERSALVASNAPPMSEQQHHPQQQRLCGHQGGGGGGAGGGGGGAATLERMDGLSHAAGNGQLAAVGRAAIAAAYKAKAVAEYENALTDSDGCAGRERCSNTLPTRKLKKRIEAGAKSIGPNSNNNNNNNSNGGQQRPNVQQVFACEAILKQEQQLEQLEQQPSAGVANGAYQDSSGALANGQGPGQGQIQIQIQASPQECLEAAESEVYFADVSSCCNMSVKNDNYYERQPHPHPHPHPHHAHPHHRHQHSNCSHSSTQSSGATNVSSNSGGGGGNNEDYLAQRFGRREHSIRSRLPFPQSRAEAEEEEDEEEMMEDDYESSNLNMPTLKSAALEQQQQQLLKDISRQSMCSIESEAKTEFTDLSPSTPCGGNPLPLPPPPANFASDPPAQAQPQLAQHSPSFVASFPYSSESQCLEAHRRSTKNIHELLLAGGGGGGGESHYEVINDRQSQRSSNGKCKSKSRSREQLDIYGGAAERSDWPAEGAGGRSSKRL